ncbi:MAG: hypothetical protein AAF480_11240 [Actinomycetota bacterium]
MLDHVFTDAIDALRQSLEKALLERLAVEEHLTTDLLSGDLSFETSYGLLGEETPPRVRADVSMVWSTWSQSAFREWYVGEGYDDPPKIDMEITLRVQRLVDEPDPASVLAATPKDGPIINGEPLLRDGPTVERAFNAGLGAAASAFEVAYGGTYELSEKTLQDSALIDVEFAGVGGWIASALVHLSDLGLTFGPAPED